MTPAMNWDLSSFFPSLLGEDYHRFITELDRALDSLTNEAAGLAPLDASNLEAWQRVVLGYEELSAKLSHVATYVHALASCDAANQEYRREQGAIAVLGARFSKIEVELLRALRDADDSTFSALVGREPLASARFALERLRELAGRSMTPELERLAADLGIDGIDAWGRLYDTLAGTLSFEMEFPDGRRERIAMSQRRSLMGDRDRRVREAAFRGGNVAWQEIAPIASSTLNHIAGARHTLWQRRGIDHFLDVAVFDAAISRRTLEALMEAVQSQAELAQRYLRIKARALGIDGIAWFDLEAPLPLAGDGRLSWEDGVSLVGGAFGRAYPALGRFFQQAIERSWVEWEPRARKQPGAYCASSQLIGESRVFMTFQGSLHDASTLAHEMGHAYHNHVMRALRPLERSYPMTLAESASVFAEGLLVDAMLGDPAVGDVARALLLDQQLGDSAIFLLDIPVRFEFERRFYEERQSGELGEAHLCELMVETQRRIFGDCLAPGGEDPLFWASKLHFYITGVSFYNFPYTFGYLLSRGLLAELSKQGPDFFARYEQFLRLTGSGPAHEIARRALGRDLETPDFWVDAIQTLRAPLTAYEALLAKVLPAAPVD